MSQERWTAVDRYIENLLVPHDAALNAALEASAKAGLPPHQVSPPQGKLLQLLAQTQGARTILEIGTLGGYSTIWLARVLPPDGHLITLEVEGACAEVARKNIVDARLDGVVEVRVGPAKATLAELVSERREPFDLVFIDADKTSTPEYFTWALELSRQGTLIVVDNVVRNGAVVLENTGDPSVQGARGFHELLAAEPRVSATTIQTVGSKGYDGFTLARVV